jgi:hypothetical protein
MGDQIGHRRKSGKLACVFPQPLVHDEKRKVFPVQILASGLRRRKDDGVMLYAKTIASANQQALAAIVNAISATIYFIQFYAFRKYF